MACWASFTVLPASRRVGGVARPRRPGSGRPRLPNVTGSSRPSRPTIWRSGSFCSRHQVHVGGVAEGADHQDARCPSRGRPAGWRRSGTGDAEEGRERALAEEAPGSARRRGAPRPPTQAGKQLGPGGGDHEARRRPPPRSAISWKAPASAAGPPPRPGPPRCGSPRPTSWAPRRCRRGPSRCRSRKLSCASAAAVVADRGVLEAPVHGEAQALPERLEGLLVLRGEGEAQLDEVAPRDLARRGLARPRRRPAPAPGPARRHSRLAADVEVVLHPALGGQAVVVPAHRVEDVPPAHPLVAREHVRLRVAEDVAHVQRARHGGRRSVDHEGLPRACFVEVVHAVLLPGRPPLLLRGLGLEARGQRAGIQTCQQGFSLPKRKG